MQPIIALDHVSFIYKGAPAPALSDVSFDICGGEFVGVIGPSGSGKSTLASVLFGAIPHHFAGDFFGSARIDGHDTCEVALTDISRMVGSVGQDIDAQMVASVVEDEVLFGLENFGVPHEHIEAALAEALDIVGIADLRHREVATLSGGQKQKVALAAILALAPRVLVLDEPTAALDPASSESVYEVLQRLNRERGITVVVIEDKVALLSAYCDRVMVLDDGRVALDGTPREVFAEGARLRKIGVDSPRVTRIYNSLAGEGLAPAGEPCLDVDDAYELIAGLVGNAVAERAGAECTGARVACGPAQGEDGSHAGDGPVSNFGFGCTNGKTPENPKVFPFMHPIGGGDGAVSNADSFAAPDFASEHVPAAQPVVEFSDVGFAYPGGGGMVEGLDLCVAPGEIVGIVGQNGAGKTTLTKLVNGLLRPATGIARVAGIDTRTVPTSQIARHVSTLFQNPDYQICKNTVLEEIAFGLLLAGVEETVAHDRARSVAERFGLPVDASPFSLSRGERQMVALASVIAMEPQVIVLDEPTSGLDYRECMTVMDAVREQAERGAAVIMVCHDMEVVSDFAQRVAVMAQGRILAQGPACELLASKDLMERASVRPPQVVELAGRLARDVHPAFAGLTEVSDVVSTVKGLMRRD